MISISEEQFYLINIGSTIEDFRETANIIFLSDRNKEYKKEVYGIIEQADFLLAKNKNGLPAKQLTNNYIEVAQNFLSIGQSAEKFNNKRLVLDIIDKSFFLAINIIFLLGILLIIETKQRDSKELVNNFKIVTELLVTVLSENIQRVIKRYGTDNISFFQNTLYNLKDKWETVDHNIKNQLLLDNNNKSENQKLIKRHKNSRSLLLISLKNLELIKKEITISEDKNFLYNCKNLIDRFKNLEEKDKTLFINDVAWEDYEELLRKLGDVSWCKISYLDGLLEIMSPGRKHETIKELTSIIITTYCYEKDIECFPIGSTTLRNKQLISGKEPDTSYAIETDKDLPDIAVEVNYSSGSMDDLEKYKRLGVREVWIWNRNNQLEFYILEDKKYRKSQESKVLTPLKPDMVQKYVEIMQEKTPNTGKREFIKEINSF